MNEFGKICTEVNTRIVQDTVWFSYYRITDDDPFGIDNYVNEFVARIGRENGRKFKFRVLMNRNTHDRLNEAYSRRISMFNQGQEEPVRKVDIRIIMSMTGSAVTVTENMALAMTEVMDQIGLGNGKRPTKLNEFLHILTDTVIDMISDRCVEMARQEMGALPNDREKEESAENNIEMPMIFNNDNQKPN